MSFGFFRNLTKPKPAPVEEREHVVAGRTLPLQDRRERPRAPPDAAHRRRRPRPAHHRAAGPARAARSTASCTATRAGWNSGWPRCPTGRRCGPASRSRCAACRTSSCTSRQARHRHGQSATSAARRWSSMAIALHLPRRVADFLKREAKREIEALVAKHTATVGRARQGDPLQRHLEPLGLLHLGRQPVLLLAHHDGAAAGDKLPRRARGGASQGDEPRPEILEALRRALPRHRALQGLAEAQRQRAAGDRFE